MAKYYNPYYDKSAYLKNKSNAPVVDKSRQSGGTTARQGDVSNKIDKPLSAPTKPVESTVYKTQAIDVPVLSFHRENLVRGIIFSEILGRPKGRTGR